MAKKRVTYRPGKVQGVFGVIWGAVFVVIGVTVAIPHFSLFGVLWTLLAVAITGYNAYLAFGKGKVGPEIYIEDDAAPASDAEERLTELRNLYDRRLITEEEYQAKRKEILDKL